MDNTKLTCTLRLQDFLTLEGTDFSGETWVKTSNEGMYFSVLISNALSKLYIEMGKMAEPFAPDYNSLEIGFEYEGVRWDNKLLFGKSCFEEALRDVFENYKKAVLQR